MIVERMQWVCTEAENNAIVATENSAIVAIGKQKIAL